jgi:hypothetical protein
MKYLFGRRLSPVAGIGTLGYHDAALRVRANSGNATMKSAALFLIADACNVDER